MNHLLNPIEVAVEWPSHGLTNLLIIMDLFDAGKLFRAISGLASFGQVLKENTIRPAEIPTPHYEEIKKHVDAACSELEKLKFSASLASAHRLREAIQKALQQAGTYGPSHVLSPLDAETAKHYCQELTGRVVDELRGRIVLTLSPRDAAYYEPAEPLFGKEANTKFPSAAYEIDEAAKCLALNRHTAAVFHLMRVMEIGVAAIRTSLSIPDSLKPAERNWGAVLRKVRDEIDRRKKTNPPTWANAQDAHFFEDAYVSLDAVKNVWRNATMHIENKYTNEEAEHVFNAVSGFMKKISSRIDEDGQPLA